jgi:DNA-binding beta-propeller fold protein YncE
MRWGASTVIASILLEGICAGAAPATNVLTLELVQTLSLSGVKGRFDHFALDASGKRLFVAALGNNTLEVLDLAAGKHLKSIGGMSKPTGVLYARESNLVLVANGDDGTVRFLDGATLAEQKSLPSLPDADNLRFEQTGGKAWVGYGEGALGVIDIAAGRLKESIKLPAHPEAFQLEKSGKRLFVNVPGAKQIAVIDRDQRAVVSTWPMELFQANFPMALDEPNHRVFVGCRSPARLVVMDTRSGKFLQAIRIGKDTDDLFYDAKRKRVYVSCGEGVIDTVKEDGSGSYQVICSMPTAAGARTSFFSPELDSLYLAVPERGARKAEIRIYKPVSEMPSK